MPSVKDVSPSSLVQSKRQAGSETGSSSAKGGAGLTGSDTGSVSQQTPSDQITAEQEYFLYELETSDSGSIGLVLRAIYDGGDVEKFLRALEKKIKHYDKDIEKLCSYHFDGFIEAIRQLLQLKNKCQKLKEDIQCIDDHLSDSSKSLLTKNEEIVRYRKLQRNIATAVDAISLCLPMLEKYGKLQEQMEQKRYYPALKTLEQLEHTYLPQVEKYRFAQKLMESVSHIRNQIKDNSFSEFTDFLENIRKVSSKIGQVALRHAAEYHDLDSVDSQKRRKEKAQKKIVADGPEQTDDDDDEEFSAQDMVDFSPVYRCCHIFTVLACKDTFEAYYRKQRREQAGVVLKAPERLRGSLEAYLEYFHEVIGFFVIEDHIMQTAAGLVIRSYRDELWELALQQVTRALNSNFGNCTDPQVMLKIKKLVLVFSLTMKGYGFQIASFYKLLQNFRDQYNEILMAECCANFDQILQSDNYTPISVSDEVAYKNVVDRFPFYQRGLDEQDYPRKFPFSEFVPNIYEQLRAYVRGCLRFMEQLGLSQSEIDDTVRRYTNVLLERLSGSLRSFMTQKRLSLVQLVQITINVGYLEKSCDSLDQFISTLTSGGQSSISAGHLVRLKEDVFRDARSEVEQRIDEALGDKIKEFLELANYDWELQSSSSGRASEYITDLISFLNSTFLSFSNLPLVLARHMCMQACKYLSAKLLYFLTGPEPKAISMGALEQFNLDVMQCELFTAQCPVAGFDEGTLAITFADLRQLLDLFMSSDWSSYLADFGRDGRSKYIRVQPQTAVTVLEKIVENERKRNTLFGKGKDKDRKKLLDTVLKQLKTLVHT